MPWDALSAIGTFLSAIVIAATAVAALIQIRHLRANNQLEGFLECSIPRYFSIWGDALQDGVGTASAGCRVDAPARARTVGRI